MLRELPGVDVNDPEILAMLASLGGGAGAGSGEGGEKKEGEKKDGQ